MSLKHIVLFLFPFLLAFTSFPSLCARHAAVPPLDADDDSVGVVTAGTLNVRANPSTTAPSLAKLVKNERIVILSQSSGWLQIRTQKGITGWVSESYIRVTSATATKTPEKKPQRSEPPVISTGGTYSHSGASEGGGAAEMWRHTGKRTRIGIGLGVVYGMFSGTDAPPDRTGRIGLTGSVMLHHSLLSWLFGTLEGSYAQRGAVMSVDGQDQTIVLDFIDTQATIGLFLPGSAAIRPFVHAGPVYAIRVNSAVRNESGVRELTEIESAMFGIMLGIGCDIPVSSMRLAIELRGAYFPSTIHDGSSPLLTIRSSALSLRAGILF